MQVNTISSNTNINSTRTSSSSVNGRGNFKSYLGETEELDAIFQKAAKKYGVDVNLLKSVARVESNFKPNAVSCVGAVGIMQLMPRTAKGLGVTNSYDAEQNIMGGAKLLSQLMKKYDGDIEMTLAGYNAGTGNVKKYGGVPPWKSVHKYINKVLGFYKKSGGGSTSPTKTGNANYNATTTGQTNGTTTTGSTTNQNVGEAYQQAGSAIKSEQLTAMLDALNQVSDEDKTAIDEVFSYDKYLKFIELFFKQQEEEKEEEDKQGNNSILTSASSLQMSNNVASMLKQI